MSRPVPSKTAAQPPFDALIGLGSNLGDKIANLDLAIERLTATPDIRLVAQSRTYKSAPWGVIDQDWFVNAAISIRTPLSPRDLLLRCQAIENEMGRVRQQHWGPRLIDIDILSYRDLQLNEADLVVPHPLIAQRSFVLLPIRDIAPHFKLGQIDIADLIGALSLDDVTAIETVDLER